VAGAGRRPWAERRGRRGWSGWWDQASMAEPPVRPAGPGGPGREAGRQSLGWRVDTLAAWEALLDRLGGPADPSFVDWLAVERAEAREFDVGLHRRWLDPIDSAHRTCIVASALKHGRIQAGTDAPCQSRTLPRNGHRHPGRIAMRVQDYNRLMAVQASQANSHSVNVVLLRLAPSADEAMVAGQIRRWKHLEAYTRADMDEILVAKVTSTSPRQIVMVLVIPSVTRPAIVDVEFRVVAVMRMRHAQVMADLVDGRGGEAPDRRDVGKPRHLGGQRGKFGQALCPCP